MGFAATPPAAQMTPCDDVRRYAFRVATDVDVMVPAYGDGPLVREAINSVLAQHDQGWRLTVIDDAAAIENGELAVWLQSLDDPRIRYLANPSRLGINRNFQRCAEQSTAEWVVILGADDRLLPSFIARVRQETARFPGSAWIHAGAAIIDDNGHPHLPLADRIKRLTTPRIRGHRVIAGEELAVSLLRGNWMYFPSCAFRRTLLLQTGFRPGYDIVLDLDLYLRLLLAGGICILLGEPGIEYRRHAASLSSTGAHDGSRFAEENAYFDEIAGEMSRVGWHKAAAAARWHLTSRMHAAAKVPSLLLARNWDGAMAMVRVSFARAGRSSTADPAPTDGP